MNLTDDVYMALLEWVRDHIENFHAMPLEFCYENDDGSELELNFDQIIAALDERNQTDVFERMEFINGVLENKITYFAVSMCKGLTLSQVDPADVLRRAGEQPTIRLKLDELTSSKLAQQYLVAGSVDVTFNGPEPLINSDGFGTVMVDETEYIFHRSY